MDEYPENPYRGPLSGDLRGRPKRAKFPSAGILQVLAVLGVIGILIAMLLPAVRTAPEAARRSQCSNQLKQIALALRLYADVYHALPPAYTTDAGGKPLHSWRTLILPYLEEERLYESIDLTKPWHDPVNAKALKSRVGAYECPSLPRRSPGREHHTTYLAVVTPNSCFRATEPRSLSDITDGDSRTLMVIEVATDQSVPWMAPTDADEDMVMGITPESPLAHPGGVQAVCVEGSVRFLNTDLPAAQRLALISIAGSDNALAEAAD